MQRQSAIAQVLNPLQELMKLCDTRHCREPSRRAVQSEKRPCSQLASRHALRLYCCHCPCTPAPPAVDPAGTAGASATQLSCGLHIHAGSYRTRRPAIRNTLVSTHHQHPNTAAKSIVEEHQHCTLDTSFLRLLILRVKQYAGALKQRQGAAGAPLGSEPKADAGWHADAQQMRSTADVRLRSTSQCHACSFEFNTPHL